MTMVLTKPSARIAQRVPMVQAAPLIKARFGLMSGGTSAHEPGQPATFDPNSNRRVLHAAPPRVTGDVVPQPGSVIWHQGNYGLVKKD